jgi:alpha-galactosidase
MKNKGLEVAVMAMIIITQQSVMGIGYTDIRVADTPDHTIRYISGDVVYVESLQEERWVGRYWSADGRINLPYESWSEDAFELSVSESPSDSTGTLLSKGWSWRSSKELEKNNLGVRHFVTELTHGQSPIKLNVHTLLDGTPVLTRWLEITNTGSKPLALTRVCPWAGRLWPGKTFSLGYYTMQEWAHEGWFEWTSLAEGTKTVDGKGFDDPFFIVRNDNIGEYFIAHLAWTGTWKMDLTRDAKNMKFNIGPSATGFMRVISTGETVVTPEVHMGHVTESLDKTVQAMHDHLRGFVLPKRQPDLSHRIQYLVPADQGYYTPFDEASAIKCVDIAASIGAELFILDAYWWDITCDWVPSSKRFPRGLKPVSDYVKQKGMLFGLYVETEGGRGNVEESRVAKEHPEWIGPKKIIDISNPDAAKFVENEIYKIIEDYEIDLYRIDFNPGIFEFPTTVREGFPENNSWRYYETLYGIYERVCEKYPKLILQQCAAGGMRNDLGLVRRFHEPYLSDGLSIPLEFQVYSGLTLGLPPENFVILHGADGQWGSGKPQNIDTILRLTYALATPQVFVGAVAPSVEEMNPERRDKFLRYGNMYKDFIRPLLPDCRVYHHAPINAQRGVTGSSWFAMEYGAPDRSKGWAMVCRMKTGESLAYKLIPKGLSPDKKYKVTIDSLHASFPIEGIKLMQEGLTFPIEECGSSELVLFEEIAR